MNVIGIGETSRLLGVSRQRVRQLIAGNRIKGVYKTEQGWQIPLYKGKPEIRAGTRGVKGRWQVKRTKKPTIIHVNKQKIASNQKKKRKDPVIIVRQGSKVAYGSRVSFKGKCQIVYHSDNLTKHGGAKVWIEVDAEIPIHIDG